MNEINVMVKCDKALRKEIKPSGTSSRIYVPKEYINKTVCLMPINEDNLSFEGTIDNIVYKVKTSIIWRKHVTRSGESGCIYMPREFDGITCLIIEAPEEII